MKRINKWVCNRLVTLLVVFIMGTACSAAPTPTQAPAQSLSGSDPTNTPAFVATQPDRTPTISPSPLASPLQTPPLPAAAQLTFTYTNGVSFRYLANWISEHTGVLEDDQGFRFRARPPNVEFFDWIHVIAYSVPKAEEHTLYHYAGEVIENRQTGAHQTVWDKQITSQNHLDWHLAIRGFSPFTGRYDGLAYIAQAGGLTEGTIEAVHYDPTRELAILISKDLDRDLLIALHESGPDAVYPAMVAVFEEILQSVAIVDQTAQLTVPDAYTGAYHYLITYPTAAWRVAVVEELEGYESPRLYHRAIDGCLLHLRDGPRGTAPDAVVIEQQYAGLTWGVTRGGELYVFYTLYQPDKGISFFIRLELPREAPGDVKAACQDAAEAVINTFTLLE